MAHPPLREADGAIVFRSDGNAGNFVVKRDRRGRWRAYYRQLFTSAYGGGWGRVDAASHTRDYALRSDETGRPLTPMPTSDAAIAQAERALDEHAVLPYGA